MSKPKLKSKSAGKRADSYTIPVSLTPMRWRALAAVLEVVGNSMATAGDLTNATMVMSLYDDIAEQANVTTSPIVIDETPAEEEGPE